MKAHVVADKCTGCELCVSICPAVFSMNADNVAEAIREPVPKSEEAACREAAESCPTEAIVLE
jgi:ferredoxin